MLRSRRKESAGTFLDIDLDNLDQELKKQAKLVKKWHDLLAEAKLNMNERKARLELIEAELRLAINENPGLYKLERATIPMIDATILTQKEYQKAMHRFNRAQYAVDVLKGTVEALDNKKKSLESEVDLFLAGYWAEPRTRSDNGDASKRRARRAVRQA